MNPERVYDYLTQARKRVLAWTQSVSIHDYEREFPIGPGSLSRIFTHMLTSEWYYTQRIRGVAEDIPQDSFLFHDSRPVPLAELDEAWEGQAARTRDAIGAVTDWNQELEYLVNSEEGPRIVTARRSDVFTQLALHEVHHRAQVLNILRQLGVKTDDIDFNVLMYRFRTS